MKIGDTIYLDHQATTPVDPRVLASMVPYFTESVGNPHSSDHSVGWQSARAVEDAAAQVAALMGADAAEIVFTSGATESNNLALLGFGRRAAGGRRRRILVSAIEHKCVLAAGNALAKRYGFEIEPIPVDHEGAVDLLALKSMADDNVFAISVMAVNNEIGTIQDIEEISSITRNCGALLHCDAAQAPLAVDLHNFSELVDSLSLSAHKMYGPQGVGVLFIRHGLQDSIEPLIYGGGQQQGLRSGTAPVALCVGMGAAAAQFGSEMARQDRALLCQRRNAFVCKLKELPWPISINGPGFRRRHPGNANMRFGGFYAHDILGKLQPRLAASTGSACTSGIPEPSHVLRAIQLSVDEAEESIRFSVGRDTTEADLEEAVTLIDQCLSTLAGDNLKCGEKSPQPQQMF